MKTINPCHHKTCQTHHSILTAPAVCPEHCVLYLIRTPFKPARQHIHADRKRSSFLLNVHVISKVLRDLVTQVLTCVALLNGTLLNITAGTVTTLKFPGRNTTNSLLLPLYLSPWATAYSLHRLRSFSKPLIEGLSNTISSQLY